LTSLNAILDLYEAMTPWQAAGWLLVENLLVFAVALGFGHALVAGFPRCAIGARPDPLRWQEVGLAAACVLFNTLVTIAGWFLWRAGIIQVRRDVGWQVWLDVAVLLMAMDLSMYFLHRLAHHPWIFPVVHRTHHLYDRPRPLDLFVLNPLEVLGFGGLWLVVITLYTSSWLGMVVYLVLNVVFGTMGHLGVEPMPRGWTRWRVLRSIGTSTFHAGHHHDLGVNFGFYTLIWDRLFGTLDPNYACEFAQAAGGRERDSVALEESPG
jgi:sterol desaturase/sphingolipid hydroxylase (fatty acid hydroxylase superfamily)